MELPRQAAGAWPGHADILRERCLSTLGPVVEPILDEDLDAMYVEAAAAGAAAAAGVQPDEEAASGAQPDVEAASGAQPDAVRMDDGAGSSPRSSSANSSSSSSSSCSSS